MSVEFKHPKSGKSYKMPGYFAADGDAGNTSAASGDKWRVHFAPDDIGEWTYAVSFYDYPFISVGEMDPPNDKAKTLDPPGATGSFTIAESDKTGRDLRAGRLEVGADRYLRFAETGEILFKLGPDAPESLLACADFDGTFHHDGAADLLPGAAGFSAGSSHPFQSTASTSSPFFRCRTIRRLSRPDRSRALRPWNWACRTRSIRAELALSSGARRLGI